MNEEAETAIDDLTKENGFHILKSLIEPDEAAAVRHYVLSALDRGEGDESRPGDINLAGLLTADPMFEKLITNPRLLNVVHALLGRDAKLAAFTAKTLMPGCGKGRLHVDYPYWAMDPGLPVEPALMLQVIWMMELFSEKNGGTWILPGSQQFGQVVDIDKFKAEAVQATGNAGDAFISHGMLWHQTAMNQSDEPRVAILLNFSQLAIRPMREMGPFTDDFLDQVSPEMKQLLPVSFGEGLANRIVDNY
jgi:hypothetical protein